MIKISDDVIVFDLWPPICHWYSTYTKSWYWSSPCPNIGLLYEVHRILFSMKEGKLQEYQINVIQMYKFKLPKNMYIQYFQSLVNEKSKLWFSVNKWLKFIYYEENRQLLCVFKKIYWKTTFSGVLYYIKGPTGPNIL